MSISLTKVTPGTAALMAAIAEEGPGLKFVSVRHVVDDSVFDQWAQVLYEGGNALILDASGVRDFARVWAVIDAATRHGHGHFAVVTRPPSENLTVTRYMVSRKDLDPATLRPVRPHIEHVRDWSAAEYGSDPAQFEAQDRARWADDVAHVKRVADVLAAEDQERAALRERLAARGVGASRQSR